MAAENKKIPVKRNLLKPTIKIANRKVEKIEKTYETDGFFKIKFPNAKILGSLLDYLYGNHCKGVGLEKNHFEINDQGLVYRGKNSSDTVLHKAFIYRENLLHFERLTESSLPLRFNVNSVQFKTTIKKYKDKNLEPILQGNAGDNNIWIMLEDEKKGLGCMEKIKIENVQYDDSHTDKSSSDKPAGKKEKPLSKKNKQTPNAVITTTSFNQLCSRLNASNLIHIDIYNNFVCISIQMEGKIIDSEQYSTNNNDMNNQESVKLLEGTISSAVAKNLCKLNKLAPSGIIKMYANPREYDDQKRLLPHTGTVLLHTQLGFLGEIFSYIKLN